MGAVGALVTPDDRLFMSASAARRDGDDPEIGRREQPERQVARADSARNDDDLSAAVVAAAGISNPMLARDVDGSEKGQGDLAAMSVAGEEDRAERQSGESIRSVAKEDRRPAQAMDRGEGRGDIRVVAVTVVDAADDERPAAKRLVAEHRNIDSGEGGPDPSFRVPMIVIAQNREDPERGA